MFFFAEVPKPPHCATVEVIDGTRVRINFGEPVHQQSTVTTKFKGEILDERKHYKCKRYLLGN